MQDTNTIEHYRERERHERTLAGMAISPGVAMLHRDLADQYRLLIEQAEKAEQAMSEPSRMPVAR